MESKSRPYLLFVSLFAVLFISCDPGQSILIQNRTNAEARVELVFSDANGYYDFDQNSDSDTLLIKLDTSGENSAREYFFGIGTWEIEYSIDTLIALVRSVKIESRKSTTLFQGEAQVRDFFKDRITGRQGQRIEIIIE